MRRFQILILSAWLLHWEMQRSWLKVRECRKRIISQKIHYSTFYQNPMLLSPLQEHIKEPSGILEVLSPQHSYIGTDGARHFEDREGKYLNIVNGHRLTHGQPKTFKRTIYIVGGCGAFGIGVRDEGTLASQLQKLLNRYAPEEGFNVENLGSRWMVRIMTRKYWLF